MRDEPASVARVSKERDDIMTSVLALLGSMWPGNEALTLYDRWQKLLEKEADERKFPDDPYPDCECGSKHGQRVIMRMGHVNGTTSDHCNDCGKQLRPV